MWSDTSDNFSVFIFFSFIPQTSPCSLILLFYSGLVALSPYCLVLSWHIPIIIIWKFPSYSLMWILPHLFLNYSWHTLLYLLQVYTRVIRHDITKRVVIPPNLTLIWHHTKLIEYYWLYSFAVLCIPMTILCQPMCTFSFLFLTCGCVRWLQRKKERNIDVRNIDWLPPIYSLIRDQICNLMVYGMMLQPTEPPSQGLFVLLC